MLQFLITLGLTILSNVVSDVIVEMINNYRKKR